VALAYGIGALADGVAPHKLACIIHTSGSSGAPMGAVVEHTLAAPPGIMETDKRA
jgi:long-subunit acyl-CoA synthetase (AMP-forming)